MPRRRRIFSPSIVLMKTFIIVMLVLLALFFLFNKQASTYSTEDGDTTAPIPPVVNEAILEKFLKGNPDLVPIDTVFINPQADGSYVSRVLFFNSSIFSGIQYDIVSRVNADGSVSILSSDLTSQPDPTVGFKPDKYKSWKEIDDKLQAVIAMTPLSLNTRS